MVDSSKKTRGGGFDRYLRDSLRKDSKARELFWAEIAKSPVRSRRKIEARYKKLPQ